MTTAADYPRTEAMHAANWWAGRLGRAAQKVTERRDRAERKTQDFTETAALLSGRTFTDEQRAAFRRELAPLIEAHLREHETGIWQDSWRPDEPKWGSATRDISIDYGAHPVLKAAAEAAGITLRTLDLPLKTVMWINPGEVIVGEGYNAPPVDVWRGEPSPPHRIGSGGDGVHG